MHKSKGKVLPPIIFIMGPTASGKTDLAIALKDHLPVELINVDSTQVYRQMDIGSAKPDAETLIKAPHRLISFRDPSEPYSAAEFREDARREISEITEQGKIPLLVGGTMLYFKILLEGLASMPEADETIRHEIEEQAKASGWPSLHRELEKVDPETAAQLHPNHSQRIQRALEVYRVTGIPISRLRQKHQESKKTLHDEYRIWQLALIPQNRALLHQRIEQRFRDMIERGFLEEVEALYRRGDLNTSLPSIRSVGYRQLWQYFEGKCTLDDAIENGIAATRKLAKRQITWLRKWPDCHKVFVDNEEKYLSCEEICEFSLIKLSDVPIYCR